MKKTFLLLIALLLLTSCTKTISEQAPEPLVYFTNEVNMTIPLLDLFDSANDSIHCALYDIDIQEVINTLENKSKKLDVKIVMDDQNYIENDFIRHDSSGLMHNKFCIIDRSIVWTGSFNPTFGGLKGDNDVIIIFSKNAADIFENEFNELWNGKFKDGSKNNEKLLINNKSYEFYFCPEDSCADKVINEINKANKSIYFATFSFTHKRIADALVEKSKEGVDIKGLFDKRQISNYSKFDYLSEYFETKIKDSKYDMHHKFFVIDNETVITGSFNPTNNGDENNDENIAIIKDKTIAEKYVNHFFELWNSSGKSFAFEHAENL